MNMIKKYLKKDIYIYIYVYIFPGYIYIYPGKRHEIVDNLRLIQ